MYLNFAALQNPNKKVVVSKIISTSWGNATVLTIGRVCWSRPSSGSCSWWTPEERAYLYPPSYCLRCFPACPGFEVTPRYRAGLVDCPPVPHDSSWRLRSSRSMVFGSVCDRGCDRGQPYLFKILMLGEVHLLMFSLSLLTKPQNLRETSVNILERCWARNEIVLLYIVKEFNYINIDK